MRTFGVILIVVGILMFVFRSINWKEKEEVVDIGSLEINKEETHAVTWPYYAGGIAILAGVVVIASGKKGKVV